MKVIKRNGSEAAFDVTKIINAIAKANKEVPTERQLTAYVVYTVLHQNIFVCNT